MSKVAAFGEVMMRLGVPGYETLAQSSQLHYSFSGSGVNLASALARYGHEAYLVTTLPDTPVGDAASAHLQKLGLRPDFMNRSGKYIGMYFLENGFGIRPSRVTYADRLGSSFNTAAEDAYDYAAIAAGVDVMHFCGITLAMNDTVRTHMKRLAAEVKRQGGTVVFDCNYRPTLWPADGYRLARPHYEEMLGYADIVLMNEKDALYILGMETGETERKAQLEALVPQAARRFGIRAAAGTHRLLNSDGTHSLTGYLWQEEGGFVFSQERRFAVLDRIGAGDAYASGIVHGLLQSYSPQRTVDYAAAAAMLAHTVIGDTPIASEADVLRVMNDTTIRDVQR